MFPCFTIACFTVGIPSHRVKKSEGIKTAQDRNGSVVSSLVLWTNVYIMRIRIGIRIYSSPSFGVTYDFGNLKWKHELTVSSNSLHIASTNVVEYISLTSENHITSASRL